METHPYILRKGESVPRPVGSHDKSSYFATGHLHAPLAFAHTAFFFIATNFSSNFRDIDLFFRTHCQCAFQLISKVEDVLFKSQGHARLGFRNPTRKLLEETRSNLPLRNTLWYLSYKPSESSRALFQPVARGSIITFPR
jgi:hypothetical protein